MSDDDDQVLGEDYEVQKILYHDVVWVLKKEGTMDKRRDLKPNQVVFRVRWVGYGPGDDTWEPAEHVQHTTVFQDYCEKHGIHGEDRLTCEGRVHKVNADGSKSVKKKSVARDPPPKKVKSKRATIEESDDDFLKFTKSERPPTTGEDAQKKKKKKYRTDQEGSPTTLKKITVPKRASIESDSDDSLQNGDAAQLQPLTGKKRSRSSSSDSLRTSKAVSVEKPKVTASDSIKHADGSSVTQTSSSHKADHVLERKKSVDGVHKPKETKKRKREDDGMDPEKKKKPRLHNEKEAQSSRIEKSLGGNAFEKTPKNEKSPTEKKPQTSDDQFMAALLLKAEKKKEKIRKQKPLAPPANSANDVSCKSEASRKPSVDVAQPAVVSNRADTNKGTGIPLTAPKAPAATAVEKQKKPAGPTRPQQAVCPFSIDSINFDERPGATAQRASPTSAGPRPSLLAARVARKIHVFFPDEDGVKQAVATFTSTREFDFEVGLEYVRCIAESEEYDEGNRDDECVPIVFARCGAARDPWCPIPRLIDEEEKNHGTDWPKVAPLRPRSLSVMRDNDYTEYRKKFMEKPATAPKASTIDEFRQFSADANGNLLWNRMKRAVAQCDLVTAEKAVETLYLPRRMPLSREGAFGRCLVQWASGEGREVIAEMFTTAAASPMICANEHQRCSFLRKLWESILPHERTNFLWALENSTDEPLSLRCVKSAAKCQLDFAIEIGVSLERATATGESALSYLLKNSLMDVVTSLLERGLDCRAALEQCAGLRDSSNWPNDWIRETMQRYLQLLRVCFAKWTIQPDVGFGSIGCYPVEPISFVRVSRMPAFGGATETFMIKMSYGDAYVRPQNTAQKVLAIYSVKLHRASCGRANTTDPRRVIGTPTVHSLQCPQGETFLHISAVQIVGNSSNGTEEPAKELSLVAAHKGRLWIYAIPPEALDGKEEVTVSTTLHPRATHEPGVMLFSQIWDATVLGPSHPVFETL